MIYGVGTDIVEIKRIEEILNGKNRDRLINRVLTDYEQLIFKKHSPI